MGALSPPMHMGIEGWHVLSDPKESDVIPLSLAENTKKVRAGFYRKVSSHTLPHSLLSMKLHSLRLVRLPADSCSPSKLPTLDT